MMVFFLILESDSNYEGVVRQELKTLKETKQRGMVTIDKM
jgi:hypothetical protein